MTADIHDVVKRLEAARSRLSQLPYNEILLSFLDHLESLGLSRARVLKYATSLCTIYRHVPFDPANASKRDIERIVAWVNRQPYREWTKHGLKIAVRKLVQYAKYGSCDGKTPMPPEVAWIKITVRDKDSGVMPEIKCIF
ncbi:MAG: hypothetical protein QXS05_04620 [Candidatus Bathyarchaeia archaeon]